MAKSAEVERWFTNTRPPSEDAMRRVRDILLGADRSMRERVQYGITSHSFSLQGRIVARTNVEASSAAFMARQILRMRQLIAIIRRL